MESLKNYSRAINIIVFLCSLITFLGVDGLNNVVPDEYKAIIPTIIMIAGFVLVQFSEDKRVERAENIATNKAFNEIFSTNNNLGGGDSNGGYRKL